MVVTERPFSLRLCPGKSFADIVADANPRTGTDRAVSRRVTTCEVVLAGVARDILMLMESTPRNTVLAQVGP